MASGQELRKLEKRLDRHPDSLAFARLADAYLDSGLIDEAIEICARGVEEHPNYVSGLVIMGRCYFQKGLLDQAKAMFEQALRLDADNLIALKFLGDIHRAQKMVDLAIGIYQRILELDPLNKPIEVIISVLEGEQITPEGLETSTGEVVEEEGVSEEAPDEQFDTITLAEIYASQGVTEKAIEVLRRILQRHPGWEEVKIKLRELEERLQREREESQI